MSDLANSKPISLAKIMGAADAAMPPLSDDELAAMLADQLAAPINGELSSFTGPAASRAAEILATHSRSFRDLLTEAVPPLELLEFTRQLARHYRTQLDGPLQKIATILYYASILAARLRCGQRISELTDVQLLQGIQWALEQPWLDKDLLSLFRESHTRVP